MDMKFTGIEYDVQQGIMILKFLITQCGYEGEPNKLVYVKWEDGEIIDVDSPDDRILEFISCYPQDMTIFLCKETMIKLVHFCESMLERVEPMIATLAKMIRNGNTESWSIKFERHWKTNILWAWVTNPDGKKQGYPAGEIIKVWSQWHKRYFNRADGTQGFIDNFVSKKQAWQALEDDFIDQIKRKVDDDK